MRFATSHKVVLCRSSNDGRHCEERSDEAISTIRKSEIATLGCASLAMTGHQITCDRALDWSSQLILVLLVLFSSVALTALCIFAYVSLLETLEARGQQILENPNIKIGD